VVLDDPVRDGEAQSRARVLRGEEGCEDLLEVFLRNPRARVGDLDLHLLEGTGLAHGTHLHAHAAALGRGLDGVLEQVQQHLLDLLGVQDDLRQPLRGVPVQRDLLLRRLVAHQEAHLFDDGPQILVAKLRFGRARELEQLAEQARDALDLGGGDLEEGGPELGVVQSLREELQERLHGDERVSDLVGEAGGERAQAREPLGALRGALLAFQVLVEAGVLDGHGRLVAQSGEELEVLGAVDSPVALLAKEHQPDEGALGGERDAGLAIELSKGGAHGDRAGAVFLALELLGDQHAGLLLESLDQGIVGGHPGAVGAIERLAHGGLGPVAVLRLVVEERRGFGDFHHPDERLQGVLEQGVELQDGDQVLAEPGQGIAVVVLALEKDLLDRLLGPCLETGENEGGRGEKAKEEGREARIDLPEYGLLAVDDQGVAGQQQHQEERRIRDALLDDDVDIHQAVLEDGV